MTPTQHFIADFAFHLAAKQSYPFPAHATESQVAAHREAVDDYEHAPFVCDCVSCREPRCIAFRRMGVVS